MKYKKHFIVAIILSVLILLITIPKLLNRGIRSELIKNYKNDNDIKAVLFYENINKIISKPISYYWKDNKFIKTEQEFIRTYDNLAPKASEIKLMDYLEQEELYSETMGQLIYYANPGNYEVFMYESLNQNMWRICFLYETSAKEIEISHKDERLINSYQIEDKFIYIFSDEIYKINFSDYSVEIITLPYEEFERLLPTGLGRVFIEDDVYVNASPDSKINDGKSDFEQQSTVLRYNFSTHKAEFYYLQNRIERIFRYKEGYLILTSSYDEFRPTLEYYNYNFNQVKSIELELQSKSGLATLYPDGSKFSLYNGKLYGIVNIGGVRVNQVVVIDVDSTEVLYQQEFSVKDFNDGYRLLGQQFYKNLHGKLVDINYY